MICRFSLMSGGGFFMKKWMLMLCFLLFFDVQMIGGMRDKTSLSTFRQAGMPVERQRKCFILRIHGWKTGIMEESGLIKGVTFLEKRTDENIIRW